jgi:2-methylcitrate dehydratase PrpD
VSDAARLDELLDFAATVAWDAVPEEVRRRARLSMADTVGVMCGGRDVGAALVARRYLLAAECTTPELTPEGLTPASRAWLMGIAGHVLDYDDTHWPTILHASNPIMAALLASGGASSGRALAEAYLVGFECASRIALSMPHGHYDRGWHITGTVGGIGAAVAVTRLLEGSARDMRLAVSAAANQASGHRQHFGSMAKSLNGGNAARTGLVSALLVQEGFLPDPDGIEGRRGMWSVMSEEPNPDALNVGLGTDWETMFNGLKPYPSGVVSHPAIEAAEEVRKRYLRGGQAERGEEIAAIELIVHPLVSELTNKDVLAEFDVKFSVKTLVAMGLLDRATDVANYGASALEGRADLERLAGLVTVIDDRGSRQEEAEMVVELKGGAQVSHKVTHALGSPTRPLSADQVRAKFHSLWSGYDGDAVFGQLSMLDTLDDVGPLVERVSAVIVGP